MTDEQAIVIIENEFRQKTLGVTEQYLEIHSPVYVENKIKIDRIDREGKDDTIIAYLPVLNESFYFAVYIDTNTNEVYRSYNRGIPSGLFQSHFKITYC